MSVRLFNSLFIVAVALAAATGFYLSQVTPPASNGTADVASYEECVAAGGRVLESYPPQCILNGAQFTQDIGNTSALEDRIRLDSPRLRSHSGGQARPQADVSSPIELSGQARGSWYFEGSFSARIVDADGTPLGRTTIQADGEWTTSAFVPFTAQLRFIRPQTETGMLILEKANPSGLAENAAALRVPVHFTNTADATSADTDGWETYTNDTYGFALQHPPEWEVAAMPARRSESTGGPDAGIAPMFNVYDPDSLDPGVTPPLTHHDRATHVSVYPNGVPTEGVFSDRVSGTAVSFAEPLRQARTHFLADGTPFATYVQFADQPDAWNESGFVWGAVRVRNLDTECRRDGETVSRRECDPLFSDAVVWRGDVDPRAQATVRAILQSFSFTQ